MLFYLKIIQVTYALQGVLMIQLSMLLTSVITHTCLILIMAKKQKTYHIISNRYF